MSVTSASITGTVPRHALRRGTRGFAAVVLFLTAWIVLSVATFVLPASALDGGLLTVLVPLGIGFGAAHLVAAYGIARRRAWSVTLILYLLAIGLGVAAFTALLVLTGIDPFAPAGSTAVPVAPNDVLGVLVWLAGSWLVAARFAVRGLAPAATRLGEERERRAAVEAIVPFGAPARARSQATFMIGGSTAR